MLTIFKNFVFQSVHRTTFGYVNAGKREFLNSLEFTPPENERNLPANAGIDSFPYVKR